MASYIALTRWGDFHGRVIANGNFIEVYRLLDGVVTGATRLSPTFENGALAHEAAARLNLVFKVLEGQDDVTLNAMVAPYVAQPFGVMFGAWGTSVPLPQPFSATNGVHEPFKTLFTRMLAHERWAEHPGVALPGAVKQEMP